MSELSDAVATLRWMQTNQIDSDECEILLLRNHDFNKKQRKCIRQWLRDLETVNDKTKFAIYFLFFFGHRTFGLFLICLCFCLSAVIFVLFLCKICNACIMYYDPNANNKCLIKKQQMAGNRYSTETAKIEDHDMYQ